MTEQHMHDTSAMRPVKSGGSDIKTNSYRLFAFALVLVDIVALAIAATLAPWLTDFVQRHVLNAESGSYKVSSSARDHIFLLMALVQLAMFWAKGLYTQRVPWWSQVLFIVKAMFFVFMIDGFVSFALKTNESRILIFLTWTFAFAFVVIGRWTLCRAAARSDRWTIPTVIIGDVALATDLIYAFNADPCAGYNVHTVYLRDRDSESFDVTNLPARCRNIRVRNGAYEYEPFIRSNADSFYVVSLDAFRGEMRERLIRLLDETKVSYAVVPAISRMGLYEMEPRYFFGHDVMMLQPRVQSTGAAAMLAGKAVKRAMDIAVSGAALLMLAPLFLAVCTMLRVEGQGGSLFYGGARIGKDGRRFSCWKFRSMEPNSDHLLQAYLDSDPEARADWEKYRKLANDPRVTTRTARFIRKASIDELPQLWNVFVGDMSLVGPRPILEEEEAYFGDMMKEYLSVRPGLTGLWQVSGRNNTSFKRRVYWDSWYVRNWSLWGDIVILIKTPIVLLSRSGAS